MYIYEFLFLQEDLASSQQNGRHHSRSSSLLPPAIATQYESVGFPMPNRTTPSNAGDEASRMSTGKRLTYQGRVSRDLREKMKRLLEDVEKSEKALDEDLKKAKSALRNSTLNKVNDGKKVAGGTASPDSSNSSGDESLSTATNIVSTSHPTDVSTITNSDGTSSPYASAVVTDMVENVTSNELPDPTSDNVATNANTVIKDVISSVTDSVDASSEASSLYLQNTVTSDFGSVSTPSVVVTSPLDEVTTTSTSMDIDTGIIGESNIDIDGDAITTFTASTTMPYTAAITDDSILYGSDTTYDTTLATDVDNTVDLEFDNNAADRNETSNINIVTESAASDSVSEIIPEDASGSPLMTDTEPPTARDDLLILTDSDLQPRVNFDDLGNSATDEDTVMDIAESSLQRNHMEDSDTEHLTDPDGSSTTDPRSVDGRESAHYPISDSFSNFVKQLNSDIHTEAPMEDYGKDTGIQGVLKILRKNVLQRKSSPPNDGVTHAKRNDTGFLEESTTGNHTFETDITTFDSVGLQNIPQMPQNDTLREDLSSETTDSTSTVSDKETTTLSIKDFVREAFMARVNSWRLADTEDLDSAQPSEGKNGSCLDN